MGESLFKNNYFVDLSKRRYELYITFIFLCTINNSTKLYIKFMGESLFKNNYFVDLSKRRYELYITFIFLCTINNSTNSRFTCL